MAEQHVYDIWLQSVLSVKCPQVTEIAAYFGSAQHIYEADEMELKICGLFSRTEFRRIALRDLKPAESIYQRCLECGIDVLSFFDSAYPESLRNIPSPPLVLYIKGKMPDLDRMKLAMVGTRTPSLLGKQIAYEFGFQLTRNEALIISGGAEGIDDTDSQGGFRPDDGQIDLIVLGESQKAFHVRIFQRDIECLLADAGVAGGAVNLLHLRAAAQGIHDGMLAAATADHEDRLAQAAFQFNLLASDGGVL